MKNKRRGGRRQARSISLSAASLATGSPKIGEPLAEHNLESGGGTRPRNQRGAGRRRKFTEAQKAAYRLKFEEWWRLQIKPKQNQTNAIEYVRTIIGDIEVGPGTITSQIIRPVLKKLKIKN
jgi:hypothetical protein